MTKEAFLSELSRLTGALNEQERARLVDYYAEMIDDRVEEGVPEETAVAALGDPADIAREFAPALTPTEKSDGSEAVDALDNLRVRVGNADVRIIREMLENGAAAQLRFSDPARFEWRMEGGTLVIEECMPEGERFSLRWLKRMVFESDLHLTVALSGGLAGSLEMASGGGDLSVENVTVGGDARLHTASGDIEASDLRVNGSARLESASGDVEMRNFDCGKLTLTTASGDIEVDRGACGASDIHSASGDVRLDEVQADPTLSVETASGDIDLTRCIARETRVKAVSGDVALRLEPLPCGYDITANTVSGDVRFGDSCKGDAPGAEKPVIRVSTVSGDIEARLLA